LRGKYILRFDDACPTMCKKKWNKLESLCDEYNIKPIVAVIPNNMDVKQNKDVVDNNFWIKVRSWQNKGWHIALHGYDHVYVSSNSGLVPLNNKSEFAGLDFSQQAEKIKKGIEIFNQNGIFTNIWVAPSHSFDKSTLKAIKKYTDISIVSDGISISPFTKYGFNWIPQQFWRCRKMPFGIWTCCIHPNEMNDMEYGKLEGFIKHNYSDFIDLSKLKFSSVSMEDKLFEAVYWKLRFAKKITKKLNSVGVIGIIKCAISIMYLYFLKKIYKFDSWHYTASYYCKPYKKQVVTILDEYNDLGSIVEIGCGLGDIVAHTKFDFKYGVDLSVPTVKCAKFLYGGDVNFSVGSFGEAKSLLVDNNILSTVIVAINWTHNIEFDILSDAFRNLLKGIDEGYIVVDIINKGLVSYKYRHNISQYKKHFNIISEVDSMDNVRRFITLELK
jgi:hypothetical protein